jgi:hypothetical protein
LTALDAVKDTREQMRQQGLVVVGVDQELPDVVPGRMLYRPAGECPVSACRLAGAGIPAGDVVP